MGGLEKIKNSSVLRVVVCVPALTAVVPHEMHQSALPSKSCTAKVENSTLGESSVSIGSLLASDPAVRRGAFGNALAMAAAELGISESQLMQRAVRNLPKQLGVRKSGWAKEVAEVEKDL